MLCGILFVSSCRLSFLQLNATTQRLIAFAALHKTHTACHCHSATFSRRLSTAAGDEQNSRSTISFATGSLLFAAVFIPALGIAFYYRKERHKLLKKYEDENVYQTPFVDTKTRLLIEHKGIWFPVVMFPSLQRFEQIRHFTLRDDDVLINSFPKSGSIRPLVTTIILLFCLARCFCGGKWRHNSIENGYCGSKPGLSLLPLILTLTLTLRTLLSLTLTLLTLLTVIDSPQTLVYCHSSHFQCYCGSINCCKKFILSFNRACHDINTYCLYYMATHDSFFFMNN